MDASKLYFCNLRLKKNNYLLKPFSLKEDFIRINNRPGTFKKNLFIPKNTSNEVNNPSIYSIPNNITHRKFHNNIKYINFHRNYLRNKKFKNKDYNLNLMKLQMTCELVSHKINQIKNRVQSLHETSIIDDSNLFHRNNKIYSQANDHLNLTSKNKIPKINIFGKYSDKGEKEYSRIYHDKYTTMNNTFDNNFEVPENNLNSDIMKSRMNRYFDLRINRNNAILNRTDQSQYLLNSAFEDTSRKKNYRKINLNPIPYDRKRIVVSEQSDRVKKERFDTMGRINRGEIINKKFKHKFDGKISPYSFIQFGSYDKYFLQNNEKKTKINSEKQLIQKANISNQITNKLLNQNDMKKINKKRNIIMIEENLDKLSNKEENLQLSNKNLKITKVINDLNYTKPSIQKNDMKYKKKILNLTNDNIIPFIDISQQYENNVNNNNQNNSKNLKININNISNYSFKQNCVNFGNNQPKEENFDNNNNDERKQEDNIKLNHNYSKDDLLRSSDKINLSFNKENNILPKKEEKDIRKKNMKKKIIINKNSKNNINKYVSNKNNMKDMNNTINSINKHKVIKKKLKIDIQTKDKGQNSKRKPRHKELCQKFVDNPQQFYTHKLNKLMLTALNIKKK